MVIVLKKIKNKMPYLVHESHSYSHSMISIDGQHAEKPTHTNGTDVPVI